MGASWGLSVWSGNVRHTADAGFYSVYKICVYSQQLTTEGQTCVSDSVFALWLKLRLASLTALHTVFFTFDFMQLKWCQRGWKVNCFPNDTLSIVLLLWDTNLIQALISCLYFMHGLSLSTSLGVSACPPCDYVKAQPVKGYRLFLHFHFPPVMFHEVKALNGRGGLPLNLAAVWRWDFTDIVSPEPSHSSCWHLHIIYYSGARDQCPR